jgi:hypothetical protein
VIASPTPGLNLLRDPGLEGPISDAWTSRDQPDWQPFAISDAVARNGTKSLRLELHGEDSATGSRIAGAVQGVQTAEFPEFLSGYYRAESWREGAPFQYLQFVIVVRGSDLGTGFQVDELRFPIAGLRQNPAEVENARVQFISRAEPALGEWTYFAYPVRHAFAQHFGRAPLQWQSIELALEVRYDAKLAGTEAEADVYFDDLYLGPQAFNPNRPGDD